MPHGTWARVKFDSPAPDHRRRLRRGARRASRPTAARSARRTARRTCAAACARSRRMPGGHPVPYAHGLRLCEPTQPISAGAPAAVRRVGVLGGQQPGRRQHVVVVDDRPGCPRQLPAGRYVVAGDGASTRSTEVRPALLRSTPPEPTSTSTSRRSLPLRSTTRPSAPKTDLGPARVAAQRHADGGGRDRLVVARGRRRSRAGTPGPRADVGSGAQRSASGRAARPRRPPRRSAPRSSASRGRPRRCGSPARWPPPAATARRPRGRPRPPSARRWWRRRRRRRPRHRRRAAPRRGRGRAARRR